MNIQFFFRKKSESKHSIENLFKSIQQNLPSDIKINNFELPYDSKGLLPRLKSAIAAAKNQKQINHITGDIHFIAPFLKKRKTILTIHDIEVLKRTKGIKRFIIKLFWYDIPIRSVKYITVISEFTKQELLNYYPRAINKIIVIPNCINKIYQAFPKELNPNNINILHIGTKHNKNLKGLIEACKETNYNIHILGKLNEKQLELLHKNKINYQNYTQVNLQKIVSLYQNSDILFFASFYEGFGLPILEAQAVGRPVITSNLASMPYVAGEGAIFVNPYNSQEIKQAIEEVISNEELRKKLIEKGFENLRRFSSQKISMQYIELYKKIVEKNTIKS